MVSKNRVRAIASLVAAIAFVAFCALNAQSNRWSSPLRDAPNVVPDAVLVKYPKRYESLYVKTYDEVVDVREAGAGCLIELRSGVLVYVEDRIPLNVVGKRVTVWGTCLLESEGCVRADSVHVHENAYVEYWLSAAGLVFITLYALWSWKKPCATGLRT